MEAACCAKKTKQDIDIFMNLLAETQKLTSFERQTHQYFKILIPLTPTFLF